MKRRSSHCLLLTISSLAIAASMANAKVFTEVSEQAGLTYKQSKPTTEREGAKSYSFFSGGAAAGDYDGDGWVDLFVTRVDDTDILYRNLGGEGAPTFQDVSDKAGLTINDQTNGAAWGDIDNDGDLDLYVTVLDG